MADDVHDEPPPGRTWRPERGRRSLTASEAASLIGVSVATVRGWADDGRLPSYRTEGGHRRFELDELRAWLTRRGASAPESRRFTRAPQEVPACPLMARELNARTESIVARTIAGFDGEVATPLPPPSEPAMRRLAVRFVRVVTAGLETGRPALSTGQTELAGLRGGLQGSSGVRVIVEHTRVALAILMEAEAIERDGVHVEPLAIPALFAVIDHAQAAVARGFEQAQGLRPGRGPSAR
jgi:excisionase family DNA binding protein